MCCIFTQLQGGHVWLVAWVMVNFKAELCPFLSRAIHVCVTLCIYICLYTCMYIYTYEYVYLCIYVPAYTHVCTHTCPRYLNTYTHIHHHVYICTNMHVYVHTYMNECVMSWLSSKFRMSTRILRMYDPLICVIVLLRACGPLSVRMCVDYLFITGMYCMAWRLGYHQF